MYISVRGAPHAPPCFCSAVQSDVSEAITLLLAAARFGVAGAPAALRRMLPLVFSREQSARPAIACQVSDRSPVHAGVHGEQPSLYSAALGSGRQPRTRRTCTSRSVCEAEAASWGGTPAPGACSADDSAWRAAPAS